MKVLVTGGTGGLGLAMSSVAGANDQAWSRLGGVDMLAAGGGRIVNISVSQSTMHRAGFVPYGPSRAGSEALSRIMAADLRDKDGPAIVWLAGDDAAGVHDQRDAGSSLLDAARDLHFMVAAP
jgi:hypothetical protein